MARLGSEAASREKQSLENFRDALVAMGAGRRTTIEKLDRPARQELIGALVAEVTPTDETKHGIESKVTELSSPSVMIRENEKAVIEVNDVGEAERSPISRCAASLLVLRKPQDTLCQDVPHDL